MNEGLSQPNVSDVVWSSLDCRPLKRDDGDSNPELFLNKFLAILLAFWFALKKEDRKQCNLYNEVKHQVSLSKSMRHGPTLL